MTCVSIRWTGNSLGSHTFTTGIFKTCKKEINKWFNMIFFPFHWFDLVHLLVGLWLYFGKSPDDSKLPCAAAYLPFTNTSNAVYVTTARRPCRTGPFVIWRRKAWTCSHQLLLWFQQGAESECVSHRAGFINIDNMLRCFKDRFLTYHLEHSA